MWQFILSDHVTEQSEAAAERRRVKFAADSSRFADATAARNSKSELLRENSRRTFRDRRYFAWLASLFPRMGHALSSGPVRPVMAPPGRDEVLWNAGGDGERRVTEWLDRQLSDEWMLIDGYHNPGGEIDKILVGPLGVLAMEIKFVNGVVSCDGDRWWRDKYDKYGNLVERAVPIADRRGRGPSAQVNNATDRLQKFLASRCSIRRIARAVILSHDSAKIGSLANLTVDAVTTLNGLDVGKLMSAQQVSGQTVPTDQIAQLICQDHAFHAKPRGAGGRSVRNRTPERAKHSRVKPG